MDVNYRTGCTVALLIGTFDKYKRLLVILCHKLHLLLLMSFNHRTIEEYLIFIDFKPLNSLVIQIFQIIIEIKKNHGNALKKKRELKIFSRQVKTTTRIISQDQLQ